MAATIDVPGLGKTNRNLVLAGGAAVAGIAAFAFLTRQPSDDEDELVPGEDFVVSGTGEFLPPVVTGFSGGDFTTERPVSVPITNAEWSQQATDRLIDLGFEESLVATALGKFLASRELSAQEADAVNTAIAQVGNPPIGGPFTVRREEVPSPTPQGPLPGKPSSIRVVRAATGPRAAVTVSWGASANATSFEVQIQRGGTVVRRKTVSGSTRKTGFTSLAKGTILNARVRGINSAGVSAWTGQTFRTKKN